MKIIAEPSNSYSYLQFNFSGFPGSEILLEWKKNKLRSAFSIEWHNAVDIVYVLESLVVGQSILKI